MSRNDFLLVLFLATLMAIFVGFAAHEAGWLLGFMEAASMCEDLSS